MARMRTVKVTLNLRTLMGMRRSLLSRQSRIGKEPTERREGDADA